MYKPPLCFVLRLRLQKGGWGVFAGHYGIWKEIACFIDTQLVTGNDCAVLGQEKRLLPTNFLVTQNIPGRVCTSNEHVALAGNL